jgi:hypothetical protein
VESPASPLLASGRRNELRLAVQKLLAIKVGLSSDENYYKSRNYYFAARKKLFPRIYSSSERAREKSRIAVL